MRVQNITLLLLFLAFTNFASSQTSIFSTSSSSKSRIDQEVDSFIKEYASYQKADESIKESFVIEIDTDQIYDSRSVSLEVNGATYTANMLKQHVRTAKKDFTWFGQTNDGIGIYFRVQDDLVLSNFSIDHLDFSLLPVSKSRKSHVLFVTEHSDKGFDCEHDTSEDAQRNTLVPSIPPPLASLADTNCTLRLLVGTSQLVRDDFTDFFIQNRVNAHIDWANLAFILSQTDLQIELAALVSTNYVEDVSPGDIFEDIDRLEAGSGALNIMHNYREMYEADLLMLLTSSNTPSPNGGTFAGVANLLSGTPWIFRAETSAFSVLGRAGLTSGNRNVIFTHELGHNLGCRHENDSGSPSYARAIAGLPLAQPNTIMAATAGGNLQYFSNRLINLSGVTIGNSGRDNARRINSTARFIRGYRVVPNHKNLSSETVPSGFISNHLGKLTVRTNGNNLYYQNGSSGTVRASNEVVFSPGTFIEQGSDVHAFIDTQSCLVSSSRGRPDGLVVGDEFLDEREIPESDFVIYPNPSNGIVHLKFNKEIENFKIEIFNFNNASLVHFQDFQANRSLDVAVDLTQLKKGKYVLKYYKDGSKQITIRQIIIE